MIPHYGRNVIGSGCDERPYDDGGPIHGNGYGNGDGDGDGDGSGYGNGYGYGDGSGDVGWSSTVKRFAG